MSASWPRPTSRWSSWWQLGDVVHDAKILDQLAPLFASGAILPPCIAARHPLSQAAEAYQRGAGGKVVLIPDRLYTP